MVEKVLKVMLLGKTNKSNKKDLFNYEIGLFYFCETVI